MIPKLGTAVLTGAIAVSIGIGTAMTWPDGHSRAIAAAEKDPAPLTARQKTLLYQAEQIAFRNCLRGRGFRYWPQPQPARSVFQLFPYVIGNVAWARANGFGGHQERADAHLAAANPDVRYFTTLPAPRQQALGVAENGYGPRGPGTTVRLPNGQVIGHSNAGCTAAAEGRLYGSFPAWFRAETFADSLPSQWQADVVTNPRFGAAVRRWSRCMRARHERYASPAAAASAFTNPARVMPRAAEIRAATAEARCALSTGLGAVAHALNARYRRVVETRYQTVITTFHRLERAALPRASALVRCHHLHCPAEPKRKAQ
jgi:hypothetical protein